MVLADDPCDYPQPPGGGPILWLKADDPGSYSIGDSISQWDDVSGNGNHATESNPGYRPTLVTDTNNLPAVDFTSKKMDLPISVSNNAAYTVLAAARYGSLNPSFNFIWTEAQAENNTGVAWLGIHTQNEYNFTGQDDTELPDDDQLDLFIRPITSTLSVVAVSQTSDNYMLYANGVITTGVHNQDATINTQTLGALVRFAGTQYFWNGVIYEFLIFDRGLSQSELDEWYEYLQRWSGDECRPYTPCPTVEDHHFIASETLTETWLLSAGASITDSILTLPPGEIAAQNLDTLASNTAYNAVISVTNVLSAAEIPLNVVLGVGNYTATITVTGIYTAQFTTGNLLGPIAYIIENTSEVGTVDIDYTCIYRQDSTYNECIAPPNGEFNTAASWDFSQGATWNETAQSANLPFNDVATHSDPFYAPAYMESTNSFTLPEIIAGEYLILAFDAGSQNNQTGLLTSRLQNSSLSDDYEFIVETYGQMYRYEFDLFNLAGDETLILFGNNGGYPPSADYPEDINLDNVCIYVSDVPPELPSPIDPNPITPVTVGGWYSCDDIPSILANWGIDIRYHRINYATVPSVWNPEDWVPWIISAWWVMFETYFCIFLVALKTMFNLVEYFLNNMLNFGLWGVLSLDNFTDFIRSTVAAWLIWLALTIIEFATVPGALVENLFILALYILAGLPWLLLSFPALIIWSMAIVINAFRELINILITSGWNEFITALGTAIGSIISVFVGIWNDSLWPFLSHILLFFSPLLFLLFNLFPAFWRLFWSIVLYVWENFLQVVGVPLSFYTGLHEGINSGAFSALANCDGSTTNFWCGLFSGLDLVNGVAGHSIFYPIVIVGIIMGTIYILHRNVTALWNFVAQFITKI